MAVKICKVEDCDVEVRARGWCNRHYLRWMRNGDPTVIPEKSPRRDSWRHGSRRGYDLGCRCFPCRLADNEYQRLWKEGGKTRVPAEKVIPHIKELKKSGWTYEAMAEEAGVGRTTPWYILSGRVKSVQPRVAEALLSVQPFTEIKLPIGPLERHIRVKGKPVKQLLDDATLRAYYRALESGEITERMADRIAITALRLTVDEIYGFDFEEQAHAGSRDPHDRDRGTHHRHPAGVSLV
jgi:transcriptional regulator with XRE-family HTH domain